MLMHRPFGCLVLLYSAVIHHTHLASFQYFTTCRRRFARRNDGIVNLSMEPYISNMVPWYCKSLGLCFRWSGVEFPITGTRIRPRLAEISKACSDWTDMWHLTAVSLHTDNRIHWNSVSMGLDVENEVVAVWDASPWRQKLYETRSVLLSVLTSRQLSESVVKILIVFTILRR